MESCLTLCFEILVDLLTQISSSGVGHNIQIAESFALRHVMMNERDVRIYHQFYQLFKRYSRLPAEFRSCFGGISDEEIDLCRPQVLFVQLDILLPVKINM